MDLLAPRDQDVADVVAKASTSGLDHLGVERLGGPEVHPAASFGGGHEAGLAIDQAGANEARDLGRGGDASTHGRCPSSSVLRFVC